MESWLRTDEYGEVRDALRACWEFSERIPSDLTYWKWLLIALHNALQGCMVIALTGSDGMGAINEKDAMAWRLADETDGLYPKRERLMRFLEMYEKIKQSGTLDCSSKHFIPNPTQDCSIKNLNTLRNEFVHFTPKGWSLSVLGLPAICMDCLEICRFLVRSSGRFAIFLEFKSGELEALIAEVAESLFQLPQG